MLKWGTGRRTGRRTGASLLSLLNDGNTQGWYRPGIGITGTLTASAWADFFVTGHDLAQGTSANQPIYFPFLGDKYFYSPGVNGNYFSTPDSAANSITGDIDIQVKVAMLDWTPSSETGFVSKSDGSNKKSYIFAITAAGVLRFYYSTSGTGAYKSAQSSAATGFADGSTHWVRVTLSVANGDVNFYTSSDGVAWAALGVTQTTVAGAIFDSDITLDVGAEENHVTGVAGLIYRAKLYSGINGTLVVDCNPALAVETSADGYTFTAVTGEIWTLHSTGTIPGQIIASPSVLGDGTNHFMQTAGFTLNQPCEYFLVAKPITWTAGDYLCSGTAGAAGITQVTSTPKIGLNAGSGVADNANATLGSYAIIYAAFNGASSSLQVNLTAATTGNAGAGNPGGLSLLSDNAGLNLGNWQVKEKIARSVVSDASRVLAIQYRLAAQHGLSI